MIKVIIFDADGMIINRPCRFSERLSKDYEVNREVVNSFFENEFQAVEIGKADLKEELEKVISKWNWKKSIDDLLRYWFETEHYLDARLVASVKNLKNRGLKCYLATNQEKYRVKYMRREMGLAELFDEVFVSCEIGYMKPSMQYWNSVNESLGNLNKNEVLVWDDEPRAVSGAKDFGLNAELYTNFEDYERVLNDYLNNQG